MATAVEIDPYEKLRDRVAKVLQEGKARAQRAVEDETLRTYHQIGHLLNDYILDNNERADYGEQVVTRLAQEIRMSKSLLYETLAFFRLEPIFHARGKLTWTHYRRLLSAPSAEAQKYYKKAVETHKWSVRELEAQIRSGAFEQIAKENEASDNSVPKREQRQPLQPLRGQLYTYRLASIEGLSELRLDVGFGIFLGQKLTSLQNARAGQKVISSRKGRGYDFELTTERKAAYYSYRARVLSVIDGDTLWLDIDCGFGVWTKQKVRLRGIDAPELTSADGVRARDFVAEALKGCSFVGVTTTKPDKYDRYLADVFYLAEENNTDVVLSDGVFLNWTLHKAELASRFGTKNPV